jgi:rhomboid protease GluP
MGAPVTKALIVANTLAFIAMCLYAVGRRLPWSEVYVLFGSQYGPLVWHGEPWRLITAMFLHLNLKHLWGNMLALYFCGVLAEEVYGSARFAGIYLLAGLAGGVLSSCLHPTINALGASGAIFGVFGALLAYLLHRPQDFSIRWAARIGGAVASIIVTNLLIGWAVPWIDNAAHLGGLLGGFTTGWLMARSASRRMSLIGEN